MMKDSCTQECVLSGTWLLMLWQAPKSRFDLLIFFPWRNGAEARKARHEVVITVPEMVMKVSKVDG